MEKIINKIIARAKVYNKHIVLPEATDERILKAASIIYKNSIAKITLVGSREEINNKAQNLGVELTGIEICDPLESSKYELYANLLYDIRKNKGMTIEQAKELTKDPVYFGVLMVKAGDADGLVSGAIHSTADTLRPALQIIKAKAGTKLVSSFFLMEMENSKYEKEYIFSDCGLIPYPTSEELAEIAVLANDTFRLLVQEQPKVAMLSYSTYGSAKSEQIERVIEAKNIVKTLRNDILIDGELQLDAAVDVEVANRKAPNSNLGGHANVLIFPNLDAGNIGYKLVERFAGANAYGPITQGLAKPINDLSRGCKVEDIVGAVAITAVQAENN